MAAVNRRDSSWGQQGTQHSKAQHTTSDIIARTVGCNDAFGCNFDIPLMAVHHLSWVLCSHPVNAEYGTLITSIDVLVGHTYTGRPYQRISAFETCICPPAYLCSHCHCLVTDLCCDGNLVAVHHDLATNRQRKLLWTMQIQVGCTSPLQEPLL
jgi:hypothetical protein